MGQESALVQLKQAFIGKPIPSELAHHERLSRTTGLAVLSSDALSSVAYATEEVLRVLVLGGVAATALVTPISAVIALLLVVVALSYRQTIMAYPGGGGAYIVAKENLGVQYGLVAAASLLVDYILTVAVSVAAGVAAFTSAVPQLLHLRVELALLFLVILMLGNLRGIRESGLIFAAPTYFFIVTLMALIGMGAYRFFTGGVPPLPVDAGPGAAGSGLLGGFLILRAFANGCTAMTGVEAVSNGVPAFKPPEAKNAASVLGTMAVLAVTMFLGITLLAHAYHILPAEHETVVSQLARAVFGGRGLPYYMVQVATMLILVLAANTAYADFPRLASIVARDRFLPRQFMNQGDRLAFSNGIVALSAVAAVLLVVFRGDTHSLIPLYMIGVFVSFTLSQAGMVLKWKREAAGGWLGHAAFNGVGALLSGIVLLVVAVTKFTEGAWVIVAVIPLLVAWARAVNRHYERVAEQLSLQDYVADDVHRSTVVVPVGGIHRAVVEALRYARTLSADVRAVYVDIDPAATAHTRDEWERWGQGVPLVVLESPYRSLMEPLLDYIGKVEAERPDDFVTVLLPEFVPRRWWHHLLHNQSALLIKAALLFKRHTVVTSVPFHLKA